MAYSKTMNGTRPMIMISNDDGIRAKGIKALAEVASKYGDVVVVAPDGSYSGQSHSMTVGAALRLSDYDMGIDGVEGMMVGGSPVDCIKLGYHLVDRKPDLILSGINHGSNTSSSVHYSGTLGAVREAALLGVKGVGFSVSDYSEDADFSEAKRVADIVIAWALTDACKKGVFYGVNVPVVDKVKGIKPVRLAGGFWREDYHCAEDPWGEKYYWLVGTFVDTTKGATDTDEYWLSQGYATICPCKIDVTDYSELEQMTETSFNN